MNVLRKFLTRASLARIFADAVLLQAALLAAFVARFTLVTLTTTSQEMPLDQLTAFYVAAFARTAPVMAVTGFGVFALSGVYTGGRERAVRRKALSIARAVAFTYAGLAGAAFVLGGWFTMPRGVIVLGIIFSLVLTVGARAFSYTWESVLHSEGRLHKRRSLDAIRVRTVLVIGGAGYIGSALLPRLIGRGYHVRLLDLLMFGTDPIKDVVDHPNLEIIEADFRQIDRIVEAMRGVDAVIHLGGIVGDPACALDEDLTVDVNLAATRVIAEIARGEGVQRLVFASTCSVYGAGDEILDEGSALNPVSLYAQTKLASEKVLVDMAGDDFVPVILRFGTIYGLSGRTRFDLVINLLTAKAITEGRITVFGGDQWRPFVHVDDAANAVFLALNAPLDNVRGEIFNVGSNGQNYTITQIGQLIAKQIPGSEVVHMGNDSDRRNYRVNFDKINGELGFNPNWTVEMGVDQVRQAISEGRVEDYMDARYSNVKSLTEGQTSMLYRPEPNWPQALLEDTGPEETVSSESSTSTH